MSELGLNQKIRVLIVDDSALVRKILSHGLTLDPAIEVVGAAADVYVARDMIVELKPNVLTLDVEMPRMDGVAFLKRLMPQYPLPVVIVSSLTTKGGNLAMEAFEYGAVEVIHKPSGHLGRSLETMMEELREAVKAAAVADVSRWKGKTLATAETTKKNGRILAGTTEKVIGIGASTGGTTALSSLITRFPPDMPGTVVVQHMPGGFTALFAERLNRDSVVEVKEARDGDRIVRGTVLIAPGGYQLRVVRSGGQYRVKIGGQEKVSGHSPSVDVLFHSMAQEVGGNGVAALLTGMGKDGAEGLLALRKSGARTLAQDEKTSVIFGMPREAWEIGAAEELVPLPQMTEKLIALINQKRGDIVQA